MGTRGCTVLLLVVSLTAVRGLEYNITTTWNGNSIDHAPVQLQLSEDSEGLTINLEIVAPFFDDPPAPDGPPGQAFYGLWEYEVVEAFFLNDDDQYLEVEVCPWGQHIVLLLNGQRKTVRHSLPLEVTTTRQGETWTGLAKIPIAYLPPQVTKFNAYGIHGSGENRIYESLYPAPSTAQNPDFHALQYFQPIDLTDVIPANSNDAMSELWTDTLQGIFRYKIEKTWNDQPIDQNTVEFILQGFELGVEMNLSAPFYNDTPPSESTEGLANVEVVEIYFLNDDDEYLQIQLNPWNRSYVFLLKGYRYCLKNGLPLDYVVTEKTDPTNGGPGLWQGSAMIPPEFFPPNVTKMNAYAMHGEGENRVYQALYPAPANNPNYDEPDFHKLELFRAIDMEFLVNNNTEYSDIWQDAVDNAGPPSTVGSVHTAMIVGLLSAVVVGVAWLSGSNW